MLANNGGTRVYQSNICSHAFHARLGDHSGYYNEGNAPARCREHFEVTSQSWHKAIARGRMRVSDDERDRMAARGPGNPRYDWAAVQTFYDAGHSYRECRARFGFCAAAWTNAVDRGVLVGCARAKPIARVIVENRHRSNLKLRLLQEGLLQNRCDACGLTEWRGKPLSIQIDHVNGVGNDNRLENLRMLCPNCHSQTETFSGRNARRRKIFPIGVTGNTPDSDSGIRGSNP